MRIDHPRLHILVAEQLLDGSNIVAILGEMGGKGKAERTTVQESGRAGLFPLHPSASELQDNTADNEVAGAGC